MSRPGDPADDAAMPPPADPWATIDRPAATVYLGGQDTTLNDGPPGPTVHQPGPATYPAGPTVHQTGPATYPSGPTVHQTGPATYPSGPTVHQTGPTTYQAGPTAYQAGPTVRQPAQNQVVPTVHLGASAPTVRADRELRFGPGVPVPPAAAPSWPGAAKRPRPLRRRLVSMLSGLLTLALLAVVGLYLWERFRPLVVEGATVAVPRPAGNRCDVTVDVVATVRTNGRSGVIRYQWFRSDAPPGAVLTERVGRGQRTATLTLKWTFSGVGTTTETATVNIIDPTPTQAGTQVVYRCRRG